MSGFKAFKNKIKAHFRPEDRKKVLLLAAAGFGALFVVILCVVLLTGFRHFRDTTIYTGRMFPLFSTADKASVYSYQTNKIRVSVHEYDEYPSHYFVADVRVRDPESFRNVFAGEEFDSGDRYAEDIAKEHNAILAVNSDFNWGLVIRNGELLRAENWDLPMLAMYKDGKMEIIHDQQNADPQKLLRSGVRDTWTFGPVLVENGKNVVDPDEGDSYHPRTALGYYSPGHYCLVVVDGRQSGYSTGILLTDLAELMKSLGCSLAYNFDGGASSQMVVDGKIINRPSVLPPRPHRNMIVVAEPE